MIIDATNLIAGRLASLVAKKLLAKEQVEIINSEKAVITGKKPVLLAIYRQKHERGDPHHGPFYPKAPDKILRRIIRGMLPYQQPRGREAYKRVKCCIGNEKALAGETMQAISILNTKNSKYMTLFELSRELGWR